MLKVNVTTFCGLSLTAADPHNVHPTPPLAPLPLLSVCLCVCVWLGGHLRYVFVGFASGQSNVRRIICQRINPH